jgi:hypothetical protein
MNRININAIIIEVDRVFKQAMPDLNGEIEVAGSQKSGVLRIEKFAVKENRQVAFYARRQIGRPVTAGTQDGHSHYYQHDSMRLHLYSCSSVVYNWSSLCGIVIDVLVNAN